MCMATGETSASTGSSKAKEEVRVDLHINYVTMGAFR